MMINTLTKKSLSVLFAAIALIVGALYYYGSQYKEETNNDQISPQGSVGESILRPEQNQIATSSVINVQKTDANQQIVKKTQSPTPPDEITDIFAGDVISKLPNDTSSAAGERYIVHVRNDRIGPTKGSANGDVTVSLSDGQTVPTSRDGSGHAVFYTQYDAAHKWYVVLKMGFYIIDIQAAADFSDDKILMGASHNVFIGKVVRQTGNKERGIGPETQFQVVVIDNIKGDLHGMVTVDQQGGYKDGVLYVIGEDGGESLLQPGSTYLFATRYNPTEDWYTLNSYPTASKLLSANTGASDASLKGLAEADLRVQQLKAAYPHEVLIDADIAHNNTRNSFESVQAAKVQ